MIRISGATFKEKRIIKKVEKECFKHLNQENFFVIDLAIVDEDVIKDYNSRFRQVDKVTDVLSFPSFDKLGLPVRIEQFLAEDYDGKKIYLGSIMICRKRAEEQAVEYGHSYEREIGFLACHGFLHILGFDHIELEDEVIMIKHQKEIMNEVGLRRE